MGNKSNGGKTRGPWTFLLLLVQNFTFGVENSDCEDIIAQGFFFVWGPSLEAPGLSCSAINKKYFHKGICLSAYAEMWIQTLSQWLACAVSITELNSLVIIKLIDLHIKGITEVQGYHFNIKRIKCET